MLMRICLILAILAALGAGTLNVLQVRDKINTLITQRDDYHTNLTKTQDTLTKTQKTLDTTQRNLDQTKQQLTVAQAAQKKAEDTATAETKRADDLTDRLAKATQDLDTTQANLESYKATGRTPQEILQLAAQIKQDQITIAAINDEQKVLLRTINRLTNELAQVSGTTDFVVKLPADLKGKVVVVDPKWEFVVLDIGDDQGVLQQGQLLVSRDGKLVAKVIVTRTDKDRSVANVMPGWKLGEIFEGDTVTPAHPAS